MDKLEQENQQELFEEFSGAASSQKQGKLQFLSRSQRPVLISTNSEQIVLYGIVVILACCFIFFLGVLRGKSIRAMIEPSSPTSTLPARAAAPTATRSAATFPTSFTTSSRSSAASSQPIARTEPPASSKATSAAQLLTDLNKPYTIQLCTYRGQALAEKEVALLRKKGYYSFIIPSGDYYQVCAGQYMTKEHAKKDLKVFGSAYKGSFLRRR